jgi:hypothetical protein
MRLLIQSMNFADADAVYVSGNGGGGGGVLHGLCVAHEDSNLFFACQSVCITNRVIGSSDARRCIKTVRAGAQSTIRHRSGVHAHPVALGA